jgi:hypothetical protein
VVDLKPDARRIQEFMTELAQADWVRRTERRVWPGFVYHFTDIVNGVEILKEGCLHSRAQLEAMGKSIVSSASTAVLDKTDPQYQDCVRLYFRPKTPTQFHMEGIRTRDTMSPRFPDAHCPVPVFLLFDSAAVLSQPNCLFSDGNLGSSSTRVFSTAAELERLPWRDVYHNGPLDAQGTAARRIVRHRCAEVLIPKTLDLQKLRYIYCRAEAERETLLHLLPVALRKKYRERVVASSRSEHFFRRHTFVQEASLQNSRVGFRFSPETESRGPFALSLTLETERGTSHYQNPDFSLEGFDIRIQLPSSLVYYEIRLELDGHLAYANEWVDSSIPF